MKNSIVKSFICGVLLIPVLVNAQIDQDRMDKDIRVAAKVLETLTQGDIQIMMYGDNVEGNYIEGYGVIFSVGGGYSVFSRRIGRTKRIDRSYVYRYGDEGNTAVVIAPQTDAQKKKSDEDEDDEDQLDLEKVMVDFLANYSQLISQLKPADKIVVSTKKSDYFYDISYKEEFVVSSQAGSMPKVTGSQGITAELLKKDHNDYISGKISSDQLIAKIKVTKTTGDEARSKDLDLFGSMLKTIYDDSYTDSYFITWKPDYERIKGIGAIYSFKVYSSYDENEGYRMPGINEKGLTNKQRTEKVITLYPIFVQSMKENIIQYGRTISSLDRDEVILLKVTLTKCDDCSIPKKIQFSVKQSVLADFNSGKLSQKDAIAKVAMLEL